MNKTIDKETKAALEKMISDGVVSRESAAKYFPELKESEDGNIVEKLIQYFQKFNLDTFAGIDPKKILVWLESQGAHTALSKDEQNKLAKGVLRSCAFSFINYLDSHRYEGKMDVSSGECGDIENAFQNAMWDRLHRYYCKYIEKQGEQNAIDKIQIGKKYKCIAPPRYSTFVKGLIYKPEDKFLCSLMNFCPDCFEPIEDIEQKHTDKVEPKFHEGDWVVYCNDDIDLITGIEEKGYCINNGGYIPFVCESDMRLWTIEDAKDGDVLELDCGMGIFKDKCIDGYNIHCYCYYSNEGVLEINKDSLYDTYQSHPATKEQRDTLEKAITNAGYRWDAEHKQLNKIEQKSATMSLDEAIEHCREKGCGNNACALEHKQLEKWLTELKKLKEQKPSDIIPQDFEKYVEHLLSLSDGEGHGSPAKVKEVSAELFRLAKLEQKPAEWSEEDENMIKRTKEYLNIAIGDLSNKLNHRIVTIGNSEYSSMMFDITECISWLEVRFKSLRQQNRWKPSDEQMAAIKDAIDYLGRDTKIVRKHLMSLYEQLKKLSEE